jgi:hypothetical protein
MVVAIAVTLAPIGLAALAAILTAVGQWLEMPGAFPA